MKESSINLFKTFSEEINPEKLQQKFLTSLLKLQNVERGSIWIKKDNRYLCIEAAGRQSESLIGISISDNQKSIVGWVIENGKMTIADPHEDVRHYKELEENLAVKSSLILCFPLFLRHKQVYGAVQIIDTDPGKTHVNLDSEYLNNLQDLINIASISLSNAILYNKQLKETESLKTTLEEIRNEEVIIGQDIAFQKSMELIESYAKTDFPILITGESGTGKELIARRIHKLSNRNDKPFLVQNCSAIPESLLESELFGYKKGAFSGATKDKEGLFEAADGGIVFLDEIGDMPLNLQASLLRVIQNNEIKPLGGTKVKYIDIKILSATNHDIKNMVADNEFRQDLFYRLSVLPLHLLPLRERNQDIPLLLKHFLKKEGSKLDVPVKTTQSKTMQILMAYTWPGNVRELENLVRYLLVSSNKEIIEPEDLPLHINDKDQTFSTPYRHQSPEPVFNKVAHISNPLNKDDLHFENMSWEDIERSYANYLLKKTGWNIAKAARAAGLNRSTFDSRIKRLKLRRDESD